MLPPTGWDSPLQMFVPSERLCFVFPAVKQVSRRITVAVKDRGQRPAPRYDGA